MIMYFFGLKIGAFFPLLLVYNKLMFLSVWRTQSLRLQNWAGKAKIYSGDPWGNSD